MAAELPLDLPGEVPETYAKMYYEHQYDRLNALESQRLTITLTVVGTSAAAFAVNAIGDPTSILNNAVVPVIVATFNLFALAYILRIAGLMAVHEKRAKRVLERFAKPLFDLDTTTTFPVHARFGGRSNIHLYVHITIAAIAILLLIARAVMR
jgi:hypothetical protein